MELNFQSNGIMSLDQYGGVWAMEETAFSTAARMAGDLDLDTHIKEGRAWYEAHSVAQIGKGPSAGPEGFGYYEVMDGVAHVSMIGAMTKRGSSMSDMPWGTIGIRYALRSADRDPAVESIALHIDSPGGSSAGTGDLADDVSKISESTPITAYVEDMAASAAYWVASQAGEIVASPNALIGSIGTYMVLSDMSAQAEADGIKTFVVRAGKFKGAGTPGTEITEDQLAHFQSVVDGINSLFVDGVARGRGIDSKTIGGIATGDIWGAEQAKSMGLIDRIGNFDSASVEQRKDTEDMESKEEAKVETEGTVASVALSAETLSASPSFQDLRGAIPGASAEFLEGQLSAGATIDQATKAYMVEQQTELDALKQQKAAGVNATAGVEPLEEKAGSKQEEASDPISEWNAAIAAQGDMPKDKAIANVVKQNSELHAAFIAAYNANSRGGK